MRISVVPHCPISYGQCNTASTKTSHLVSYLSTSSSLSSTANNDRQVTRYTIDTPPIDPEHLRSTVERTFTNFHRYLNSRPVAGHTLEAFQQLQEELLSCPSSSNKTFDHFILDSGCGTGRSSLVLGELFPDKMVVGVDRSIDRLGRVARDLTSSSSSSSSSTEFSSSANATTTTPETWEETKMATSIDANSSSNQSQQHVQRVRENVILVRAELVHFWCLWWEEGFSAQTDQHYLLYPNPYPKKSRLKQRWYAHPSFPLLLLVAGGSPITIRTNWEQYAQEFADATEYASEWYESQNDTYGDSTISSTHMTDALESAKLAQGYSSSSIPRSNSPTPREPINPWTNFEAKYDKIGEVTYQLTLQSS